MDQIRASGRELVVDSPGGGDDAATTFLSQVLGEQAEAVGDSVGVERLSRRRGGAVSASDVRPAGFGVWLVPCPRCPALDHPSSSHALITTVIRARGFAHDNNIGTYSASTRVGLAFRGARQHSWRGPSIRQSDPRHRRHLAPGREEWQTHGPRKRRCRWRRASCPVQATESWRARPHCHQVPVLVCIKRYTPNQQKYQRAVAKARQVKCSTRDA